MNRNCNLSPTRQNLDAGALRVAMLYGYVFVAMAARGRKRYRRSRMDRELRDFPYCIPLPGGAAVCLASLALDQGYSSVGRTRCLGPDLILSMDSAGDAQERAPRAGNRGCRFDSDRAWLAGILH